MNLLRTPVRDMALLVGHPVSLIPGDFQKPVIDALSRFHGMHVLYGRPVDWYTFGK